MNKKNIMKKIADEYNQYSKGRSFYSVSGDFRALKECQISMNTISDIINSLGLTNYEVKLTDDEIMGLKFKWYKMVAY